MVDDIVVEDIENCKFDVTDDEEAVAGDSNHNDEIDIKFQHKIDIENTNTTTHD